MLVGATICLQASAAHAVAVEVLTRAALGGTDFIDWGALGVPFMHLSAPLTVLSNGGLSATVSQPGDQELERRDQTTGGWAGNFAPGDGLLWNGNRSATISIAFATPVSGAGAQIQRDVFTPFTVTLTAFDPGGAALASFSRGGMSNTLGDNSAVFLGVINDVANIARITYSVEDGLALNRLDLTTATAPTPVPEPGTLLLLATALTGAIAAGRRGRS
jgi:hypothetical protein